MARLPPEPVTDAATTVGAAAERAVALLRAARSPSARLDAEVLLAHALDRDRSWVLAHPEAALEAAAAAEFEVAVRRRAEGEPVAYIRGFKEWRSLRIRTDARALIPRPETELMVEAAVTASENLAAHGVQGLVQLALADLLAPAGDRLPRPDVLTANLPYVASAEVDER